MKPFVTYEKRFYHTDHTLQHLSRRQRQLLEEPYLSAVTEDLSNVTILLSESTQRLLLESIESLSRLDGYIKDKLASFPTLLLRTEALSSSQIEHYSASNRNVALAQINKKQSSEAMIIKSNLESLISGLSSKNNLDVDTIIDLNKLLLSNENIDIRKRINWIGTPYSLPHEASYVPPHPDHLELYMNQFISFCKRNDIHPLIQAAFAHAYFEIIHPFEDGNGRVGRILIQLILKEKLFLEHLYMPFSVGIVKDQERYVNALDEFKLGNFEPIIIVLLENALGLVPKVYHALEQLLELKQSWRDKLNLRQDALAWKMLDDFITQPVIDVKYIKEKHNANDQAVRNNIEELIKVGIISPIGNNKRDVAYESKEVLDLLDQFIID
ncbi:Fic family protein [Peloplasma aerotolerans]|uniref:Fic family protein n=1 Tax=Peloplasma aerotolerans TaxID=3044389 RepID=A0AAW6UEV6_9MOLU|nr:Fic family protein [Mariniplasma sp. M4Ah]MDI6453553.1 Fic family protein [Mariniplasma sp. M4Ah]